VGSLDACTRPNFTLVTSLGDIDLLGEIPGGGSYEDLRGEAILLRISAPIALA
jgi:hypothetical protein